MAVDEKRNQRLGCAIIVAAALVFLLLGLWLAPLTSEVCQKDQYTGKRECSHHNVIYASAWDIGNFLEGHSGAINGLASLLLAFITWKLVGLSREQANTTKAQLRAYLSVIIGGAIAQDSATGLRFQGDAILKNGGQTPAYNVQWEVKAEIIRDDLLPSHSFVVVPIGPGQDTLGAGETRVISGVVPHLMNDADVENIKTGFGQALHLWGTVTYEDIFKQTHSVRFCHRLNWINDTVYGRNTGLWSGAD